ncbi:MAG: class I SAM-dependent DNA methyltransferase [Alphaproteobacteria bacterium]|nr:class I SAM-dependent DNA methyltransferase [Alphaproteobacteria bacterium]
MPLSWNQIRANAARFSEEWKDAHYEKGESQTFYNEFFEMFGHRRRSVAVYEHKVKLLKEHSNKQIRDKAGYIDLFWPNTLIIEQKSAGRNLAAAKEQAMDYIQGLKEPERPRFLLLSDFQNFELHDFEENDEWTFRLSDLKDNVRLFGFIAGYQQQKYRDQDPVNIQAANLMGNLHGLLAGNGYEGHDLQLLLVRIMFCLFADDTGIFNPDSFLRFIEDRTKEDGSDLGAKLIELFQVLDTASSQRQRNLDESLAEFPYVNGQLFRETVRIPAFTQPMRQALLQCCNFHWAKVSPALFGSLFQTVMLPAAQRAQGAHYTSEKNILKTIRPLFLDDLHTEFENIKNDRGTQRQSKLKKFHDKIASLTFFDPACGCGNFLILAYRELRELELKLLEEAHPRNHEGIRQTSLDVALISRIRIENFFGIEIEEFPVRVAETTMWIVEHQLNQELGELFGIPFVDLPLKKKANIHYNNALRIDWREVLVPDKCSYILGNPPFIGSKFMSEQQREEIVTLFPNAGGGILDYVSGWYFKAADYIKNTTIKVAFVSTNSITQGEQVGVLWDYLCNQKNVHIHFAHKTFKWTIDAQRAEGMDIAAVYVVIIGFAVFDIPKKCIYDYERVNAEPHRIEVSRINGYLVDAANIFIKSRGVPICDVPEMGIGNKPIDDGNYLFTTQERDTFLLREPAAGKYFRKWIGSDEFINGYERWCLYLADCPPDELRQMPLVMERVENVRQFRLRSKSQPTRKIAAVPTKFHVTNIPTTNYLVVPEVSSENRQYIPIGFMLPNVLASNLVKVVPNATFYHFGILTSAMHMAWVSATCGRLEGRYRYSKDIVYNNFPWPIANEKQRTDIMEKAQIILDTRSHFSQSSLADLYNPTSMPPDLHKAHEVLNKAVDKAYRAAVFNNDRERVEFLLNRYLELNEPLTAAHTQALARPRSRRKEKG